MEEKAKMIIWLSIEGSPEIAVVIQWIKSLNQLELGK